VFSGATEISSEIADDHYAPCVLVIQSGVHVGKIIVFWGREAIGMKCRRSTNAEDISSFDAPIIIEGASPAYPQVFELLDGKIWIFFRYSTRYTGYRTSSDGGSTWSARTIVMDSGVGNWAYHMVTGKGTQIHCAWWRRIAGPIEENVYYLYSSDNGITWKKRDGTIVALPATCVTADLVYDTAVGKQTRVDDIKLDASYNPYILANDNWNEVISHFDYHYYDGGWTHDYVADSHITEYCICGEGSIDDDDVNKLYIGVNVSNIDEVQEWTKSGGVWGKTKDITTDSSHNNFRIQIVRNYSTAFKIIWNYGIYTKYDNYDTEIRLYEVEFVVDSGSEVYIKDVRDDFGDVRFTASDGTTLLDYFMERKTNRIEAVFWVELADDLTSDDVTFYIYYDKVDATTTSNGETTFPWLFDDLDNYTIGDSPNGVDWATEGVNPTNTITVQLDPADASKKCFRIIESGDTVDTKLKALLKGYRTGFAFHYRIRGNVDSSWYLCAYEDGNYKILVQRAMATDRFEHHNGVAYIVFNPNLSALINTWYEQIYKCEDIAKSYMHLESGILDGIGSWYAAPTTGINYFCFSPYRIVAQHLYIGGVGQNNRYVFIRKFVDPEPTWCATGEEEEPEPEPEPEEEIPVTEKQHITDAIKEWMFQYPFQSQTVERVRAGVISRIEERKRIKSIVTSGLFRETRNIRGEIGLERFEETLSVKFPLIIKFTEVCPIMGNIIKKFEETNQVTALVFKWFVEEERIYSETKSVEENIMEELMGMELEDEMERSGDNN